MLHISAFFTFSNELLNKPNCFSVAEVHVVQLIVYITFSFDCPHGYDIVLFQFIVFQFQFIVFIVFQFTYIKLDIIIFCIYYHRLLDPM